MNIYVTCNTGKLTIILIIELLYLQCTYFHPWNVNSVLKQRDDFPDLKPLLLPQICIKYENTIKNTLYRSY